jgi:LacI family transcriptional regulator
LKPTIKDVARLAGVSVGTTSKVINGKGGVASELQWKVNEAIRSLNYHPNAIARSLKSSNTSTVAMLLADITNPFQTMMAKGVEEVVYESNYQLLISSTKESPEIEGKKLLMLHEKRVEGVIICSTGKVDEEIRTLIAGNVRIVFVDRPVYRFQADIIADNSTVGMELLIKHLYDYGHRRIGVIHGDLSSIHGQLRYEGVMQALARFGLDVSSNLHIMGNFTFEGGVRGAVELLGMESPPTAILAANNNMTAGVLRACRDNQIRIPQDVSVVSFGKLEYSWDLITPTLTHVSQSPLGIGRKAAELLLRRLSGQSEEQVSHIFLTPELVLGESSGFVES